MTRRSWAVAGLLATLAGGAQGEHGSPMVVRPFDATDVVPTNVLVPLKGVNGVPHALTELESLEPRLVAGSASVGLRVVDAFDDMEGHATPFPDDGGGYGENLILLAPRTLLSPHTRYAFTLGTGSAAISYFDLTTGPKPDTTPPVWREAPFVDLTPTPADEPVMPATIRTAVAEPSDLPLYFLVELQPREPQARPKRMIAALHLPSTSDPHCAFVSVWDHVHGVYAEDTDSDFGRRYIAQLTAIDAAGSRRRAPGPGVPLAWSGGVSICNDPKGPTAPAVTPAPPQWLDKPALTSTADKNFEPTSDRGTPYEHSIKLTVETTTVVAVELTLRRSKGAPTSYRRVALLAPTKPASPRAASASSPNCAEPLITNADREKTMPPEGEPLTLQIALIDPLGRRLEHIGPLLTANNLHPARSRINVCARAKVPK